MSSGSWKTTPIVVVGINRSGTKWLSNEIAAHPDVACVQAEIHGGIVESNMLTDFGRGFDLSSPEGYDRLIEFWRRTHFFALAGGSVERLTALDPRPRNSVEAFRFLMEDYALGLGKAYWVQKIAPRDANACLDILEDARVVVIRRSGVDTVRSKIHLDAARGVRTRPLRAGMSLGTQSRLVDHVIARGDALVIEYETLVSERAQTIRKVFEFVGLRLVDVSSPYTPNTSFKKPEDRRRTLGPVGEATVRIAEALCRLLPLPLLLEAQRRMTRRSDEIIPGTYAHQEA